MLYYKPAVETAHLQFPFYLCGFFFFVHLHQFCFNLQMHKWWWISFETEINCMNARTCFFKFVTNNDFFSSLRLFVCCSITFAFDALYVLFTYMFRDVHVCMMDSRKFLFLSLLVISIYFSINLVPKPNELIFKVEKRSKWVRRKMNVVHLWAVCNFCFSFSFFISLSLLLAKW